MGYDIDRAIGVIEAAQSLEELKSALQHTIEDYGFASFAFLDVSHGGTDDPLVIATNDAGWDRTYRDEGFVHVDPCLAVARRCNVPFTWRTVPLPERRGKRLPGALRTMQAARDHGYRDGLVIPFHYADHLGRIYSSVCTFFWKEPKAALSSCPALRRHLHLLLLYWAQRAVDLAVRRRNGAGRFVGNDGRPLTDVALTDRERDVLSWAARGKTVPDTAEILSISDETVETHVRNAIRKIGASNKTHAAVKAIYLGLIDV